VSLSFLTEAAKVVVTYRNEEEFTALKKVAGSQASFLHGHQVDVTDDVAVGQMVKAITTEGGRLDVMVNAVGGYAGGTPLLADGSQSF
jgi:NADP-dependent 3-hydroxy acid dehydrogenase YdfG